jgi:large subunit ribosomal protein L20
MARTKSTAARKHRKIMAKARGYKNARSRRVRAAKEALLHAGQYAYAGRRLKKRDMRKLWIIRLNASCREHNMSYSKFIDMLAKNKIEIDRKILADIAVNDTQGFEEIINSFKQ